MAIRELMNDVAPREVPLIDDYLAALDASTARHVDGLEFGLDDVTATIGPLVVLAGTTLFTDLGKWAIARTEAAIETYIKKGMQKLLSGWIDHPKKGGLHDVLTEEG